MDITHLLRIGVTRSMRIYEKPHLPRCSILITLEKRMSWDNHPIGGFSSQPKPLLPVLFEGSQKRADAPLLAGIRMPHWG